MAKITIVVPGKHYQAVNRGSTMDLERQSDGCWQMTTSNASTAAWNRFPSIKYFANLKEVSEQYKTWRGVESIDVEAIYKNTMAKIMNAPCLVYREI